MSLSIRVTAPSGELSRLSAGVDRLERRGDHVDRGELYPSSTRPAASRAGEHTLTRIGGPEQNRRPDVGGSDRSRASDQRVPADRRLRVPVRLRDDRAGRAERERRVAVPAEDGLAERVRRDPRPRCRRLPARPGRCERPGRPTLHPGHDGPRDELGDADGLGHRPRCAEHRAVASRHRALAQPPALADRPRRRPRDAADDRVRPGLGGDQARVRARVRLRRAGRRTGSTPVPATEEAVARSEGMDLELRLVTDLRLGFEGPRARARTHAAGGRGRVRRARAGRSTGCRRATRRRPSGWRGPAASGRSGSSTARFPITHGAPTCSAARSRSRA